MDFARWYNPSQAFTVKHVSYPQLTATVLNPLVLLLFFGNQSGNPPAGLAGGNQDHNEISVFTPEDKDNQMDESHVHRVVNRSHNDAAFVTEK